MTRTAPLCAGPCRRTVDDDQRPWAAVVGDTNRGPRVYFVCPDCEDTAVPDCLKAVGGGFVVRLASNHPREVLALLYGTLSIAWADEDERWRN